MQFYEYVQSQINLMNLCSPSSPLSVFPAASSHHAESHDSFVTWNPPISKLINNKPKSEEADSMLLPAPHLPDRMGV